MWEDRKGTIWIGTLTGLSSFDGYAFRNYTLENGLPNDVIFGITEDQKGNLWLATDGLPEGSPVLDDGTHARVTWCNSLDSSFNVGLFSPRLTIVPARQLSTPTSLESLLPLS